MGYSASPGGRTFRRPPRPPKPRGQVAPPASVAPLSPEQLARLATVQAFRESGPSGVAMLRRGGVKTAPALAPKGPPGGEGAFAWASKPKIGWRVTGGELATRDPIGTARHEVAHHLIDLPPETEHHIIRETGLEKSPARLAMSRLLASMEPNRLVMMVRKLSRTGPGLQSQQSKALKAWKRFEERRLRADILSFKR